MDRCVGGAKRLARQQTSDLGDPDEQCWNLKILIARLRNH